MKTGRAHRVFEDYFSPANDLLAAIKTAGKPREDF